MTATSIYDIPIQTIQGETTTLRPYAGKVLLIVNVASKCGFTPQYEGLESLYQAFKDKGLVVLGFPCNQFGAQEPGNAEEIQQFCKLQYGVTFPLFAKIEVNGKNTHPLYTYLKAQAPGLLGSEGIKWNFTKFLVSKDGQSITRYAPKDTPESLQAAIEKSI